MTSNHTRGFCLLFIAIAIFGCSEKSDSSHEEKQPDVTSPMHGSVQLSAESLELAHIESMPVSRGKLHLTLKSPGRISVNVNETAKVTSTFEGRIASLTHDVGSVVQRGEIMGLIDSPELLNKPLELKAPISGQVIERHGTVGEAVDKAKELFTISDLRHLWCIAEIKEKDIAAIRSGQHASMSVLAYPNEKFTGTVVLVGHEVEEKTRTLEVRIEVDNSTGKLKPGMFAEVELVVEVLNDVIVIPDESLQTLEDEQIVFVVTKNNEFEKRVVKIGREQGGQSEILEGLSEGEKVVVKGSFILKSELLKGELGEE